ncbi:hypothetical protein LTR78_009680 [Recurvomyces mirabilis]|uniref:Uncharacterized protein n=1 Tax=Recurvomyces mirabilis TaxID=574656 RepID=A0AAE0TNE2_9PEZI|nr:hypothetical protein LTR78_009680 [Recurvomyces mirabilis]KAK5150279.1 hypothetical protein LTS14_010255 [Recurvomyces mirabilis]
MIQPRKTQRQSKSRKFTRLTVEATDFNIASIVPTGPPNWELSLRMAHSGIVEPVEDAPRIDEAILEAVDTDAEGLNGHKVDLAYGIISSYLQARSDGSKFVKANYKRVPQKNGNASGPHNPQLFDDFSPLRCMLDAIIAAEHHWRYKKYCALKGHETESAIINLRAMQDGGGR